MGRMTEKGFFRRCAVIMASKELTEKGKKEAVKDEAGRFLEDIIWDSPEIRNWTKKVRAVERKHENYNKRPVHCSHCGKWLPKAPPEIKSLEKEWTDFFDRKKRELEEKVLAGAPPPDQGGKAA